MTHSTFVGRRGARARLTLLSLSTILGAGLGVPAIAASDYTPPKVDTRTPSGVNLADGSFILDQTDLSIGPLSLERIHLGGAKDPDTPFFGPRMTHNWDIYVAKNTTGAVNSSPPGTSLPSRYKPVVHLGSGASGTYVQDMSANPIVSSSNDDANSGALSVVGGAYVYVAQDGTTYTFNSAVPAAGALGGAGSQRVSTIVYPNGRTLTFSYNSAKQLKLINDNTGYALLFDYNGNATVSAACAFSLAATNVTASSTCAGASLKVSYGYTSSLLTSVTDVFGNVTTYAYTNNEITCITPPGATSCKVSNTYGGANAGTYQVTQQTLGDGSQWNFAYSGDYSGSRDPSKYVESEPTVSTTVTDPTSAVSHYFFVKSSPYSMTDALSRSTSYRYTGGNDYEGPLYTNPPPVVAEGSMLVEVDLPEGNSYLAEHAGPYNSLSKETWTAKPNSGVANAVLLTGYSCPSPYSRVTCTRPAWKKDANGNQTDYTYTSFGSPQSEMQPAPTQGAARPLKLYTYGQRYAYVKNASGTLVASTSPIWLPSTETQCQTAAGSSTPTCDTGAQQMMTSYEYGADGTADNLLLRGKVVTSNGQSLRTCYRYDAQSNKIAETSPRAGLTSCPAS